MEDKNKTMYEAKLEADRLALRTRDLIVPVALLASTTCIILILIVLNWSGM
jgi:hypothetical protein